MTKTMLVTGASRGIGASIARAAAKQGYQVVVNFHRSGDAAQRVVDGITSAGGSAVAMQGDVGQQDEVRRMFRAIDERYGAVDVLVNNAGVLSDFTIDQVDEARLDRVLHANLYSAFYCCREAVARMALSKGGKGGVIVNMSSVASRLGGLAGGAAYAASKGAIDSFTLALAKEVGKDGIRVNAVRPGLIETDIHSVHGGLESVRAMAQTAVPMGRSGDANEVANAVLWLATAGASYVHGTTIDVAGGR
jgi:NAD(P)-dependent dehydrogenase (short-subunit alcohol dehydrogenase family)